MIKLIVAGGRNFNDYELFLEHIKKYNPEEIVCGMCPTGADYFAVKYAIENNIKLMSFPAEWGKYGRYAGPRRNEIMAKYGTHLLAFWDGESKGTKSMILLSKKYNIQIEVILY